MVDAFAASTAPRQTFPKTPSLGPYLSKDVIYRFP